ncbi:MAG: PIG-L family deacetylase, partial [Acidobacteriota bacterium]
MLMMKRLSRSTAVATALAVLLFVWLGSGRGDLLAQNRKNYSVVNEDGGHIALGLALRKLNVSGTFMQAPAHPDDETNSLFVLFTHGMGLRSVDVQNNRGEGGQNEIGPELFRDMGVLRTSELLSAHRIDGAEQYFTRAIDYGYSFDPNEVIQRWGREAIVGDYVRLIRTLRPDVMLTMNIQGGGGDRAHEATTILAREAYRAAGDPTKYPEQLRDGLRPWQPLKLYFAGTGGGRGGPAAGGAGRGAGRNGGGGQPPGIGAPAVAPPAPVGTAAPHVTRIDTSGYDSLLGRTYADIAADARSNHKCQGVGGGLPALPGGAGGRGGPGGGGAAAPGGPGGGAAYTLMETTIPGAMEKDETSFFDGVDVTLVGLASRYAGPTPPAALTAGLAAVATQAQRATQAFDAGLSAIRALRAQLGSMGLSDNARYEIDFRLALEEKDYENAVFAAHDLAFQAVSDDGLVIAGQPARLTLVGVNRGAADVDVTSVTIAGFDGQA